VPSRSPHARIAGVAQAADAAHHAVDVGHLERDVVERTVAGARIGDAMVRAVAAQERHVPRAVRDAEPEVRDSEPLGTIHVRRVEHDM
jgi:hypothetical protein